MNRNRLAVAMANAIPLNLAEDLGENFLTIRQDAATRNYGPEPVECVVRVIRPLGDPSLFPIARNRQPGEHDPRNYRRCARFKVLQATQEALILISERYAAMLSRTMGFPR